MKHLDLRHVARLARLRFRDEELKVFESQINEILDFVDALKKVPVEGIEPTSHPLPLANVFRPDAVQPSLAASKGRFFQVPKIIEDKT